MHDQFFITTDAVILIDNKNIVLIKRQKEPFLDKLVLPGGHVDLDDKNTKTACARELEEEIGLLADEKDFELLMVLDKKERDPRPGRRVSVVYLVRVNKERIKNIKAGDDAKEIVIREIASLRPEEMGFDHYLAIEKVKEMIK